MKRIILGSASPRRRELLQLMGLEFEVMVSEAEECYQSILPQDIVKELALRKAQNVAELLVAKHTTKTSGGRFLVEQASRKEEACVVIGADTIVVRDGQILGKPKSQEEAFEMLKSLQGRAHEVYTGVALLEYSAEGTVIAKHTTEPGSDRFLDARHTTETSGGNFLVRVNHAEETKVFVHEMDDKEIREYISTGEAMDKAGAYGIQGRFATYIDRIEGDYYNVVGLPVAYLYQQLKEVLS